MPLQTLIDAFKPKRKYKVTGGSVDVEEVRREEQRVLGNRTTLDTGNIAVHWDGDLNAAVVEPVRTEPVEPPIPDPRWEEAARMLREEIDLLPTQPYAIDERTPIDYTHTTTTTINTDAFTYTPVRFALPDDFVNTFPTRHATEVQPAEHCYITGGVLASFNLNIEMVEEYADSIPIEFETDTTAGGVYYMKLLRTDLSRLITDLPIDLNEKLMLDMAISEAYILRDDDIVHTISYHMLRHTRPEVPEVVQPMVLTRQERIWMEERNNG